MNENERKYLETSIDHIHIADIIFSKELGDIFTIKLPEDAIFTESDYTQINSLFNQNIEKAAINDNLSTNQDFMSYINEQNTLTIYKDTSKNLSLFIFISERIYETLDKYPKAYPLIINKLVEKIPESQRNEIAYLPIEFSDQFYIEIGLDDVPTNVLKAIIRLTNDPNKKQLQ